MRTRRRKNPHAVALRALAAAVPTSEKQAIASRANGLKGGRPLSVPLTTYRCRCGVTVLAPRSRVPQCSTGHAAERMEAQ